MQTLAIHTLSCALLAAWFAVSSAAAAEPKSQYGGFSSHSDSLQIFYDYIHGQEMIKVEAGPKLRRAVEAIPVDLGVPISIEQEADLRDWFYDFLVAHSVSGSDSLAALFYLRKGFINPVADVIGLTRKHLKSISPDLLVGDTPFDVFKAAHRLLVIEELERDYLFGKVSFFDSLFKVFEMQEEYDSYQTYAETHGMLPRGVTSFDFLLRPEIEERLRAGEKMVFVDVVLIVEEPAELTTFEIPGRTPSFFRLFWDPAHVMWRPVEAFFSFGVPQAFLLGAM